MAIMGLLALARGNVIIYLEEHPCHWIGIEVSVVAVSYSTGLLQIYNSCTYIYIYIIIYTHMCVYIYIYRERERERDIIIDMIPTSRITERTRSPTLVRLAAYARSAY